MTGGNGDIVRRYYEEFWNQNLNLAPTLIAEHVVFHGDNGSVLARNRAQLLDYARTMLAGFPDLSHRVVDLAEVDGQVRARVEVTGTHLGVVRGVKPGGRRVRYALQSRFKVSGGKITACWMTGNAADIARQIRGAVTPGPATAARPSVWERIWSWLVRIAGRLGQA
jgi:predicted ester cyclase